MRPQEKEGPSGFASFRANRSNSIDWHVYRPPPEWIAANLLKRTNTTILGHILKVLLAFRTMRVRKRNKLKSTEYLLCSTRLTTLRRCNEVWQRFCTGRRRQKEAEMGRQRIEEQRIRSVHLQGRITFITREIDHRGETQLTEQSVREALLHDELVGRRILLRAVEIKLRNRQNKHERAVRCLRATLLQHDRRTLKTYFLRLQSYFARCDHHRRATLKCHREIHRKATQALIARSFHTLQVFSRKRMYESFRTNTAAELRSKNAAGFVERYWMSWKRFLRAKVQKKQRRIHRSQTLCKKAQHALLRERYGTLQSYAQYQAKQRANWHKLQLLESRTEEQIRRHAFSVLVQFVLETREEGERQRVRRLNESLCQNLQGRSEHLLLHIRYNQVRSYMRRRHGARLVEGVREEALMQLMCRTFGMLRRHGVRESARRSKVDYLAQKHTGALLRRYYLRWRRPTRKMVVASNLAVRTYKASLLQARTEKTLLMRYFRVLMKLQLRARFDKTAF